MDADILLFCIGAIFLFIGFAFFYHTSTVEVSRPDILWVIGVICEVLGIVIFGAAICVRCGWF